MNPRETEVLTQFIDLLRRELGLSVLLIEHHMEVVMGISDRITVLDYGTRIAEGTPAQVQRDSEGHRGVSRARATSRSWCRHEPRWPRAGRSAPGPRPTLGTRQPG